MITIIETIKQYLVGLGFEIDKSSFNTAEKALGSIESGVASFASTAVKTFGAAATAMAAFGVAAATASAKFLNGLAEQQISMEILSRQLWTTQQNAMAFNATLKAMGTNLQSLYLSPTLMNQYQQLHSVAMGLTTPGDYNQQIQQIQNIRLQFEQMKLEAYYSLQWIGYWFIKYMDGPITNVHNILQQINSVIVKNMPTWTKKAAEWMASFWQAGIFIVKGISDVYNWLVKIGAYIPEWVKIVGGALALISISNPFMLFIEGIAAAILLWDDFQTYLKDPSKSAFPQLWAWVQTTENYLSQLFLMFQQNGSIGQFDNALTGLWGSLQSLGSALGNVITGIGNLFNLFSGSNTSGMTGFFQLLMNMATASINLVADSIKELGYLANMVGDLLHGNWKGVLQSAKDFGTTFAQQMTTNVLTPQGMSYGPSVGPPSYPYMWSNSGVASTTTSNRNSTQNVTVSAPLTINNNNYGPTNANTTNQQISTHVNKVMHNIRPAY